MSQILNIEKYKTGIPKIASSLSKMNINGIFKIRNITRERSTNFCSCRFFNFILNYDFEI
tara:strand:+ start:275234 stop:275413 length:180 start_codon:yes stop_codon:yes gene_type:complete